jgi:hypothetical protein
MLTAGLSFADIASGKRHRNELAQKKKIDCRYCKVNFKPKNSASSHRDWCYEWMCERQRERDHAKEQVIRIAAQKRAEKRRQSRSRRAA